MDSGTISGKESPPGMVSAPEHTALLCLQRMTEILSPVYYTGVLTHPNKTSVSASSIIRQITTSSEIITAKQVVSNHDTPISSINSLNILK